jgi:subtilisin
LKIIVFALMFAMLLVPIVNASAAKPEKFKDVLIGFEVGRYDPDVVAKAGGHLKKELKPLVNALAAKIPERLVELLEQNPAVKYVEEDAVAYIVGHAAPPTPEYANSWGVDHIEADTVHSAGNLGGGINIALIDTGINYNHPDLAANYKGGYDFVNDDSDPMDDNNHGSHVAGTLAAVRDGSGVVGVAPSANIYALKVAGSDGRGSYSDIVAALNWAASNDMHIASLSIGGTSSSTTLANAVKNAYDSGVLVVAAAGNAGSSSILYPAAYEQAIAVGATDSLDKKASWSNYGAKIELVAPGVSIKSTVGSSGYDTYSGTSMATPHVSGVAALVWASGLATTNAGVRTALQSAVIDLGASGRDINYGYGLIRADKAAAAPDTTVPTIKITSPAGGSNVLVGMVLVMGISSDNAGGSGVKTVQVKLDTGSYATATPRAPGDWSTWTMPINIGAAGQHRILSRATDNSGNQAWNSIYVNAVAAADSTKPSIKITSPAAGSTVPAGTVAVTGTASDNSGGSGIRTVQVKLDTGSYATATPIAPDWSSWSINVNIGSAGSHRILSRVTDNAGNQSWNSVIITVQ